MPVSKAGGLSLLCGLAVNHTLRGFGVSGVSLKWPNDVLIQRDESLYKLAGILVELSRDYCVIGIGLNMDIPINTHAADGVKAEVPANDALIPWTDLARQGCKILYSDFVERLIIDVFHFLDRFSERGLRILSMIGIRTITFTKKTLFSPVIG